MKAQEFITEQANPRVDLTPNYPNYQVLVGEFLGVKKNRYLFQIVAAELKPGQGPTEKIVKSITNQTPFGIEIERVKNRKVVAEKEQFNQDIMQPGFEFEQEMAGITYKVTNDSGVVMVTAWDSEGNSIGHAVFWKHQTRSGLESLSTEVNTKWHGKGIAANMYALVRMLGANINPSLFQTKQGKNMWKKWQQQGDVAHLKRMNAKVKDQDVAETINTDILNKRFRHKQVIGDYTYKASVERFMGEPLLSIKAYDGDREIGHVLFEIIVRSPGGKRKPSADYLESGGTEVDPAYRNKGVASTMYAYAKMLGNDIQASYNQTSQGQAMWAAWEKAGDAKHLVGTSMESTVSENFDDGKVSGKSRPGRVKRAGASCSGSVTDLRARAKNASGERAKMYHWCANMKSGRNKN